MNKKLSLFLFITILLILIFSLACVTTDVSETKPFQDNIRIMTFNAHHCAPESATFATIKDVQNIASFINKNKIDISGLNEMDNEFGTKDSSRSSFANQPKTIAELTQSYYIFGSTLSTIGGKWTENTKYIESGKWDLGIESQENKGNYGNAIISKFQITNMRNYGLPKLEGKEKRACLYGEVTLNNLIPFSVFVTHLADDSHQDRIQQIKSILNIVKKQPTFERIILMGDLNYDSESSKEKENIIQDIKDIGLKDAAELFPEKLSLKTYPADSSLQRLDYIFVSPDIKVSDYQVIDTGLSDHRAVIISISLR